MSKKCILCETEINDDARFCTKCGQIQPAASVAQPVAEAPAAPAQPVYEAPVAPAQPVAEAPVAPTQPVYEAPVAPTQPVDDAPAETEQGPEVFRDESEVKYISKKDKKKGKKKKGNKGLVITLIIVIIVAALGVGGFFAVKNWDKLQEKFPWLPNLPWSQSEEEHDYSVKVLVLDNATKEEIEDLKNYKSLEQLTIKNSSIDNKVLSDALKDNATITSLSLISDGISDISFISTMKSLKKINLDDCSDIKWGDVTALREKFKDAEISFSTVWSRALIEEINRDLQKLPDPESFTAYISDMDDNGIPEIAIGKGENWNYPSYYFTYGTTAGEDGKDTAGIINFPCSVYLEVSGSGTNSAHFIMYKGSQYVRSEVYDGTGYFSTGLFTIKDGLYVLEDSATKDVEEDSKDPYVMNSDNNVLDTEEEETEAEEPVAPETETEAPADETETPDDETAEPEVPEVPEVKYDPENDRKTALDLIFPDYADYTAVVYEEVCNKADAAAYLSNALFINESSADKIEVPDKPSDNVATLQPGDIITTYAPDGILDGVEESETALEIIDYYKKYYVPEEDADYSIKGEISFIGAVEVYEWDDIEKAGETHTEYLYGDKSSDGLYRNVAFFVDTTDGSIVRSATGAENVLVWYGIKEQGKQINLKAAQEFFNETLGIEGTVLCNIDGTYSIFYENGENSQTIYADWNLSKAWVTDAEDNETEVYPTDATNILG